MQSPDSKNASLTSEYQQVSTAGDSGDWFVPLRVPDNCSDKGTAPGEEPMLCIDHGVFSTLPVLQDISRLAVKGSAN